MARVLALFTLLWMALSCSQGPKIFDPQLDADAALAAAQAEAGGQGKAVLVVFGADWCPVCRSFERDMVAEPLASAIAANYITIKVDVGDFDRNMDFSARLGRPTRGGIPALAIVAADGTLQAAVPGPELAQWRRGGTEGVISALAAHAPPYETAPTP